MTQITNSVAVERPDQLLAALQRRRDLVDRLKGLAARQAELVEARRTDALLGVLAQRQKIIDEVFSTQDEFRSLTSNLEEVLQPMSEQMKQRVRSLISDIQQRFEQVIAADEEAEAAISNGRDDIRKELTTTTTVKRARTAYRGPEPDSNRFSDRTG